MTSRYAQDEPDPRKSRDSWAEREDRPDPKFDELLKPFRPRMPGEYEPALSEEDLSHQNLVRHWDERVYRGRDVNDARSYERHKLELMYGNQHRQGIITCLMFEAIVVVVLALGWIGSTRW